MFQSGRQADSCLVPCLQSSADKVGRVNRAINNYSVSIAQFSLSLIVTALIGVKFSQVCPQNDEQSEACIAGVAFLPASHSTTTTDNLPCMRLKHGQLQ